MGIPNRDIVGKKYNNLLIISESGTVVLEKNGKKSYKRMVSAVCDCGKIKDYHVKLILNNTTKSCGCKRIEFISKYNYKHGYDFTHPLYKTWMNMKTRCYDENAKGYKWYGGSGVTVCDEWRNDYKSFYDWAILNGWAKGLQIDKDINGNGKLYSPENCCFVDSKTNCNNRRNSRILEYNGVSKTVSQWSECLGINQNTLRSRLFILKMPINLAFNKPVLQ